MNCRAMLHIAMVSCIAVLCCSTMARATAILSVSPSGTGTFLVQGTNLENVAAMELVIGYDSTTMANPRVIQKDLISDVLMSSNTNELGIIRIGFVRGYPKVKTGSGPIAVIPYNPVGGSSGKITYFTATLLDVNGAQLNKQTFFSSDSTASPTNTGDTGGTTPTGGTTVTTGGSTTATGPNVIGGSVALPSDGSLTPEKTREEAPSVQAEAGAKGSVGAPAEGEAKEGQQGRAAALPPAEKKVTVHKSTLERFREFTGEKTPKNLTALFDSGRMPGIRQEPPVAISDGKTRLKVSIELPAAGKETPNFALRGAQMVSVKMAENNKWVIEALPETGVYDASITVMQGLVTIEIPLAVAPRVAISTGKIGTADEAGFALFLKTRGSAKSPRFDLNGDGVRNYIDDYIFTANYLAEQGSKSPATDKKTP